MVWPQFSNLKVDCWLHRGNYSIPEMSLCLFHASNELGSPILEALKVLQSEHRGSQLTLTFAENARDSALTTLRLKTVPASVELQIMSIQGEADSGLIEMTDRGLILLFDAVSAWLEGMEDFGVSPRNAGLKKHELGRLDKQSSELWFWGPYYQGP